MNLLDFNFNIINEKSVCLARKVTRTLAVVTSCCTNSFKFAKVTPIVPGYGCWLDVSLIGSHAAATAMYRPPVLGSRKTIMRLR